MDPDKKVSIILPVFNGERYLATSIESCLNQTYRNIELIIVNDCSTDRSLNIAKKYQFKDNRISIISNTLNKKLPASLNIGHEAAKGNYLTWTSDDNLFENNAIERLLSQLLLSETDIVYSNFYIIEENGKRRKKVHLENASPLLFGNSIGASFLYRKTVFESNKGYNESLHTAEDFDFWLRATLHSKFLHVEESHYKFRSHSESLSSQLGISDTLENKLYTENIKIAYQDYLKLIGRDNYETERYAEILTRIHLYKEWNVLSFLQNYSSFKELLSEISEKSTFLKMDHLSEDLNIRIRANIQQYKNNQTLGVLMKLLSRKPGLLLKYDRKNSLKIIQKCLK